MEHDVRTPCTSPMYVTHGRLSEGGISSYENPVPPCRAMPTCRWGVWEGTDPSAYQKEGTRSSAKRHARREIWISAESKKKSKADVMQAGHRTPRLAEQGSSRAYSQQARHRPPTISKIDSPDRTIALPAEGRVVHEVIGSEACRSRD